MRAVGVDADRRARAPAAAPGRCRRHAACACGRGAPLPAFAARRAGATRLVAGATGSPCCRAAARWRRARLSLRCPSVTVAELRRRPAGRACARDLIEPLCVAALNTPADAGERRPSSCACCSDALFGGPGSADLLLPRVGLGALLPDARAGLARAAAARRSGSRIASSGSSATAPAGASTASASIASSSPPARSRRRAWSRRTHRRGRRRPRRLRYEPIVTVYARSDGCTACREPMLALRSRRRDAAGAVRVRPRPARRRRRACSPS